MAVGCRTGLAWEAVMTALWERFIVVIVRVAGALAPAATG